AKSPTTPKTSDTVPDKKTAAGAAPAFCSFFAFAGAQGAVRCCCPFQLGALGSQPAISEDWQHHALSSGATRLEDSPLKAAFLEALNAAHHPLALYPPQQIRTDSFSQAFFDYLRAIDRLLSMPRLLQQRSDLQAQLPRGAFSDRPICALVPGVPQDGYVHCVAGDACNKPSSYAGVAKATRDLEQHTDTYLDLEQYTDTYLGRVCAMEKHHGSAEGESPLIARGLVLLVKGQVSRCVWHGKGAKYAECSGDKDTRAASNAIKAKLRTARQLLKEAALYQALGSGEDAAAVSIIEEQLQAMHMIVVCKGACGEPEAHGEAESGQLQQSLHIGRLFYIKQHMQQYQDMLIKAEGMHMS
ncbi:hypothetical protein QJQ45_018914, partial [Haematococcus lacustris]